jgi:DNA invertase Pin-like site-specific DNA recombinase
VSEMTTMPRRAYSYLRFSSKKQAKGESRRRQLEFAEAVCERRGWCLDDSLQFEDLGMSAYRGKNADVGALSGFLAATQTPRVSRGSVLIVESLDRLSREEVDEAYDLFRRIIKAGVTIVTREPEREYSQENMRGNMLSLLEPLFIMARAHEESAVKSMRARDAWEQRRRRVREDLAPVKGRRPSWIELADAGYRLRPGRCETVRAIFAMAREGLGAYRIANFLRAQPGLHPPLGVKGEWGAHYVRWVLRSRAAYGAYESAADGSVVEGYYPAVVSEGEWLQAQAAAQARKRRSGRPAKNDMNLFTGLAHDAVSRGRLQLRRRVLGGREYCYLSTTRNTRGTRTAGDVPYRDLRDGVLRALAELTPADVLPPDKAADAAHARIADLTGRLVALDHRRALLEGQLADLAQAPEAIPSLVAAVQAVAAARGEAARELEGLKLEATSGMGESLGEVQSLLDLLREAEGGPGEAELCRRVKGKLPWLVDSVWVYVQRVRRCVRILHVQIYLRGGQRKYVRVRPPDLPPGTPRLDLEAADFRAGDVLGRARDAGLSA